MAKLTLNGTERETDSPDVAALLEELGFASVPVLVEHQGTALFPRDFAATPLSDGDTVEVIRVVAGG